MFKIMIGTLYSGESDYEHCLDSVKMQHAKNYDHIIFKKLPQNIAHYKLYKRFMNSQYKYLVKLDADMVFMNPDCLSTMIYFIESYKKYRISFTVFDSITNSNINGIHIYSKGVKWNLKAIKNDDNIYPDRLDNLQTLKQKKEFCMSFDFPLAYHCKFANPLQYFKFTYTRYLKKGKQQLLDAFNLYSQHDNEHTQAAMKGIISASDHNDLNLNMLEFYYNKYKNNKFDNKHVYELINKIEV